MNQARVFGEQMDGVCQRPNARVFKRAGQVAGQAGLRIQGVLAPPIVASVEYVTKVTMDKLSMGVKTLATDQKARGVT